MKANTTLLTAAPDLYSALERLLRLVETSPRAEPVAPATALSNARAKAAARAALSKATGK